MRFFCLFNKCGVVFVFAVLYLLPPTACICRSSPPHAAGFSQFPTFDSQYVSSSPVVVVFSSFFFVWVVSLCLDVFFFVFCSLSLGCLRSRLLYVGGSMHNINRAWCPPPPLLPNTSQHKNVFQFPPELLFFFIRIGIRVADTQPCLLARGILE